MLTIRESSWLTDNTYSYEDVVKMMAELLGTFSGDIQVYTYLHTYHWTKTCGFLSWGMNEVFFTKCVQESLFFL